MKLIETFLTAPAYAKHVGVSTAAVYKAINNGRLTPTLVGACSMPFFDPAINPFKDKRPK